MNERISPSDLDQVGPQLSFYERASGVEEEDDSTAESITEPFDPTLIRVANKPITIDLLMSRLRNNELDLAPNFQRKSGIWSDGAQSRLIESLLIRIPLPAFYMDATDDDKWIVVDGLQRLTALKRFVLDKNLRLADLEFLKTLNSKKFEDISRTLQRRIGETQVTVHLIEPGTPPEVKFNIFKRINTGGLPLSPQEIRHALNQGSATKLLGRLADSAEFQRATDWSIKDERMADREFVLRFLAFSLVQYTAYRSKDFDSFLNDRMAEMNKMTKERLDELADKFKKAMIAGYRLFENDAFRKRYSPSHTRFPINKALFEAWSVNLSKLSGAEIEDLIARKKLVKEKFMQLMNKGGEFDAAVSQSTGDLRRVRMRFSSIENLIGEVLSG